MHGVPDTEASPGKRVDYGSIAPVHVSSVPVLYEGEVRVATMHSMSS